MQNISLRKMADFDCHLLVNRKAYSGLGNGSDHSSDVVAGSVLELLAIHPRPQIKPKQGRETQVSLQRNRKLPTKLTPRCYRDVDLSFGRSSGRPIHSHLAWNLNVIARLYLKSFIVSFFYKLYTNLTSCIMYCIVIFVL